LKASTILTLYYKTVTVIGLATVFTRAMFGRVDRQLNYQLRLSLPIGFILSCLLGAPIAFATNHQFTEFLIRYEEKQLEKLREVQQKSVITEFVSDGCSGFQSESWHKLAEKIPQFRDHFGNAPPWEDCCIEHDKAYWRGETEQGYSRRLKADKALMQCVIVTGERVTPELVKKYDLDPKYIQRAFDITAQAMYRAVRFGGMACTAFPWRWGYGWPKCE
jgi:hypothetical protein